MVAFLFMAEPECSRLERSFNELQANYTVAGGLHCIRTFRQYIPLIEVGECE